MHHYHTRHLDSHCNYVNLSKINEIRMVKHSAEHPIAETGASLPSHCARRRRERSRLFGMGGDARAAVFKRTSSPIHCVILIRSRHRQNQTCETILNETSVTSWFTWMQVPPRRRVTLNRLRTNDLRSIPQPKCVLQKGEIQKFQKEQVRFHFGPFVLHLDSQTTF